MGYWLKRSTVGQPFQVIFCYDVFASLVLLFSGSALDEVQRCRWTGLTRAVEDMALRGIVV